MNLVTNDNLIKLQNARKNPSAPPDEHEFFQKVVSYTTKSVSRKHKSELEIFSLNWLVHL